MMAVIREIGVSAKSVGVCDKGKYALYGTFWDR